jgi:hypothetical protein
MSFFVEVAAVVAAAGPAAEVKSKRKMRSLSKRSYQAANDNIPVSAVWYNNR